MNILGNRLVDKRKSVENGKGDKIRNDSDS